MDKIKNIGSILEVARSQISKQSKPDSSKSKNKLSNTSRKKAQKLSSAGLKRSITKKLKSLDVNNKNYAQQSNNIFLETVLLWEFGEEIINSPDFHQMISKINSAISQDKETAEKFSALIKQLTSNIS